MLATLFVVSLITFSIFEIIPGDPMASKLGMDADQAQITAMAKEYGLDKPLYERYITWIGHALQGNLGQSIRFDQPVNTLIGDRLIVTFTMMILSLAMILIIGLLLSVISAKYNNQWLGTVFSVLSQIGMALPSFWLGIILTYIFGLIFHLFTPGRYVDLNENLFGGIQYLFFPAMAIAIPKIAVVVRYFRNSIIEQQSQNYVKTAYSKGLSDNKIMFFHVLRNALIPVVTMIGMMIADILGGSLIIEQVFSIPGMGRLLVMGINTRDYVLVEGMVIYIALIVVSVNFIVDMLYQLIDPRMHVQ